MCYTLYKSKAWLSCDLYTTFTWEDDKKDVRKESPHSLHQNGLSGLSTVCILKHWRESKSRWLTVYRHKAFFHLCDFSCAFSIDWPVWKQQCILYNRTAFSQCQASYAVSGLMGFSPAWALLCFSMCLSLKEIWPLIEHRSIAFLIWIVYSHCLNACMPFQVEGPTEYSMAVCKEEWLFAFVDHSHMFNVASMHWNFKKQERLFLRMCCHVSCQSWSSFKLITHIHTHTYIYIYIMHVCFSSVWSLVWNVNCFWSLKQTLYSVQGKCISPPCVFKHDFKVKDLLNLAPYSSQETGFNPLWTTFTWACKLLTLFKEEKHYMRKVFHVNALPCDVSTATIIWMQHCSHCIWNASPQYEFECAVPVVSQAKIWLCTENTEMHSHLVCLSNVWTLNWEVPLSLASVCTQNRFLFPEDHFLVCVCVRACVRVCSHAEVWALVIIREREREAMNTKLKT